MLLELAYTLLTAIKPIWNSMTLEMFPRVRFSRKGCESHAVRRIIRAESAACRAEVKEIPNLQAR